MYTFLVFALDIFCGEFGMWFLNKKKSFIFCEKRSKQKGIIINEITKERRKEKKKKISGKKKNLQRKKDFGKKGHEGNEGI